MDPGRRRHTGPGPPLRAGDREVSGVGTRRQLLRLSPPWMSPEAIRWPAVPVTIMPASGYMKPGLPATVARCPAGTGMAGRRQSVARPERLPSWHPPSPDAGSPGTQHAPLAGRSRLALAMPTPNQA
jgi:hypothetical protein